MSISNRNAESGKESGMVQSLERTLEIIEALSESKDGLGITQISKATGINKTTVYRLLNTLVANGYAQKNPANDNYELGMMFLKISSSILDRMDIKNIAKPYLAELSNLTREVVHLAILDGEEIVYIDKMESIDHTMRIHSTIGKRSPIHCTALGKIFLAYLPEQEVTRIIDKKGLKKYTKSTITTLDKLMQELEFIRTNGYAFDEMEHEMGIRCVGAPVFDRRQKNVAAISVTAPEIYMPDERMPVLVKHVTKIANDISFQLGYTD